MTNNSPFDDHIKKQFGNYTPEVPPHVWENIVARKEQKKPGGFLFNLRGKPFTIILFLVIATGAGALLVHNIYENDPGVKTAKGDQSIAITTIKDGGNIINEAKKGSEELTNNQTQQSSTLPVQNVNANNEVAVAKNSNSDPTKPETRNNNAAVSNKNFQVEDAQNKNVDANTAEVLSSKTTGKHLVKKKPAMPGLATGIIDEETDASLVSTKNKSRNSAGRSAIAIQSPATGNSSAEQDQPDVNAATTISNSEDIAVENRYIFLNKPAEKTFDFSVKSLGLPALNIPCPGGKNGNVNKYFEIYGGPDYAFRSFNDTANSVYLQKRKESTSVSSAFSVGLRFTKVFNSGLSFRTGVNYSQVNEKFKFEQGHIVQLVYMINDNGDTTGSYATTGTRYKTTHNRYRTIDIPLLLGYETAFKRFRANFNAGLIVNAYSWQRGDLLDSAYQPVNITTGKTNSAYQFKTNVGLGVTGGVSLYYRLKGNTYFLAEPYFRYNFSAANKAEITLKQKYTTLGLRLGLRIDF